MIPTFHITGPWLPHEGHSVIKDTGEGSYKIAWFASGYEAEAQEHADRLTIRALAQGDQQ